MKQKKAMEINQQLIISILAIVFIITLLTFTVRSCGLIKDKTRDVILTDLENGLRNLIELLSSKDGSLKHEMFEVPEDVNMVCFVDLSHSDIIMNSTQLTIDYPMINDSLKTSNSSNVFLMNEKNVVHSFYGGDICFDYYPFYSCVIVRDNLLDVWFEGRGGCTTLYINWSIFPDNYKEPSKYTDNPLFLIKEENINGNIINWREILSIVPLTLFRENDGSNIKQTYVYNFSVAYKASLDLTTTDVAILMNKYSTNKAYLFNHPNTISIAGLEYVNIPTPPSDYLEFWKNPKSLILVDYDNEHSALIASLLAAYVNTPLIFIDENNLADYKYIIDGTRVFIVTHSDISLDNATYNYVKDYALSYDEISDTLLGIEGSVEAFAQLYSNMTIS